MVLRDLGQRLAGALSPVGRTMVGGEVEHGPITAREPRARGPLAVFLMGVALLVVGQLLVGYVGSLYAVPGGVRTVAQLSLVGGTMYALFVYVRWVRRNRLYRAIPNDTARTLRGFIRTCSSPKLYTTVTQDGREVVTDSLALTYRYDPTGTMLYVTAHKGASAYNEAASKLAKPLAEWLGHDCTDVTDTVRGTVYAFKLVADGRIDVLREIVMNPCPWSGVRDEIPITGGLSWRFTKAPHALIAGVTGGGKSVFITYLLMSILRLGDESGGAGIVRIADPKNSELASLATVFGSDSVAVTTGEIARMLREAVEEMERRYAYMNDPERFRYGATWQDHGLRPMFVIWDEFGAAKAAAPAKVWAEMQDYLANLVLKARASGIFVVLCTQQPRAETISTQIRDQMGIRISCGNLSSEGNRMLFGSTDVRIGTVTGPGEGYCLVDGWQNPKPVRLPWLDASQIAVPRVLANLYAEAERRTRG